MSKTAARVARALAQLIASERAAISNGLPSLQPLNDALDIDYARHKLRLLVRQQYYTFSTSPEEIDLAAVDFTEVLALLERRPELAGRDPVIGAYLHLKDFLDRPVSPDYRTEFLRVLERHDRYATLFSPQETLEFLTVLCAFANSAYNRNLIDYFEEIVLVFGRVIYLQFGSGKRREAHLPGATYNILSVIAHVEATAEGLHSVGYVIGRSADDPVLTPEAWSSAFAKRYRRYLAPIDRMDYYHLAEAAIALKARDMDTVLRLLRNVKFSRNDLQNFLVIRTLLMASLETFFFGDKAARRRLRSQNLTPEKIRERIRKRIAYLRKNKPHIRSIVDKYDRSSKRFRKIEQLLQITGQEALTAAERRRRHALRLEVERGSSEDSLIVKAWITQLLARLDDLGT